MKKILALVLALAMLLSVTAAMADGIKVGIINLDPSESGYREANVKDLNDTFTAENGYDAKFATAPTADKQLEAAKGFITDGVKYILVSAAETTGWDEVLQEAKDNGIGVFLFDRLIECDSDLFTAAVVSDMAKEGETAVAWLESLNLDEYKILHIMGQMGSAAQIGRSTALQEKCDAEENWTLVREGTDKELLGWIRPLRFNQFSADRSYFSWLLPKKKYAMSTNLHGGPRAFLMNDGYYAKVLPMDLYPVYLAKACLAGEIEKMEKFGIYEVLPEDLATCEFVDPSKNNIQAMIEQGINLMLKEMA